MSATTLHPMCFIAMPFGRPPSRWKSVDFDEIHQHLDEGAQAAGLEAIRADFEPSGGFIHKPMLERLLVAEYVIADLTLANPNVTYEVGVRHGATARATLLVCAEPFLKSLPFDFRPLRVLPYKLSEDGHLPEDSGGKLAEAVRKTLTEARSGNFRLITRSCRSPRGNRLDRLSIRKPTFSWSASNSRASWENESNRRSQSGTRRKRLRGWRKSKKKW